MCFDPIIFLYALYVSFGYAVLAFGATYFRNSLDAMDRQAIIMGETIATIINPVSYSLLGVIFLFFCIFAVIALSLTKPTVLAYVFPLALFINILQLLYRAAEQKSELCTKGIILRHLFLASTCGIEYSEIARIEIEPNMSWFTCRIYELPFEYKGSCDMNKEQKDLLLRYLASNADCDIIHH